ncbi:MAG: TIGR03364 family FAD-dependent oxidoreductase [Bacteroidota bacterium]
MKSYDILVVGAGILGISHALHCLRAGLEVALIERNDYPQDATVRNFGQVVPSGFGSEWQQLGRESLRSYKAIQQEMDITVKAEGSLYIASDNEELQLLEELAAINQMNDYPSQLLSRQECLARYDGLQPSYTKGALFFPDEITVDPRQLARRLIHYCINKYSLHYYPNTTICEIIRSNGRVVATSNKQEQYSSQKLFLCSGTDYQQLFPEVFAQSDLRLVKLQMLETATQPRLKIRGSVLTGWTIRRYESFQECPSFATVKAAENPGAYHRQKGIHILIKQSNSGSIILGDSHEYTDIQRYTALGFDTDNIINKFILSQAQRIFDLNDWRIDRTWLGYYCQCKEADIFNHTIDEHIHIITGIGGKGMTGALGYAKANINKIFSLNINAV